MPDWLKLGLYHTALILGGIVIGFAFLGLVLWRVARPEARTNPWAARCDPITLLTIFGLIFVTIAVFGFW